MNKKGFTLIEIIAAVIILGVISIVAVVTYTSSMKEFRESYYSSLERTLVESGKEFFEDNRSYRPTTIFTAQKVPVSILESKSYIDDIKDYNGDKCDRSSYVIAIKAAKNDYIYHACLACSEDTYSNLEDKYCDSSWDDSSTVKPDLAAMDDAYVYKNTSQEKLREKLKTAVSVTKFDREGNVVDTISGDGVDGIPEILPENIDIVDTSKVGTYTVTYKYNGKSVDRRVHVYENGAPEVTIYKTNTYAKKIVETTVTEDTSKTLYTSGQWAQEVNIDFKSGSTFYSESGEKVTEYQWNKGGQWAKICDNIEANGSCHIDYRQEMNEEVAFRVVDNEGNISQESTPVIIRVDRTSPSCTLKVTEGTPGLNDWYNSIIKIKFDVLKDQTSTITEAKSGIEFNSIRRGTAVYNQSSRTSSLEITHPDESQYVWYYGFVEDKAQNYARCSIKVRKDTVVPSCSITSHSTVKCTDATSKLVKVYFGKTANSATGESLNYLSEWTSTGTVDSTGVWYLKATDHSGLTYQTSSHFYLVTYDKNGGNSGPTKTSEIKRETELADLTPTARKIAYKMIGWNTNKNATTAITSHTVTGDVTLYAIYQKCATGYYTDSVGTGCTQCPAGYRDGEPVGAISDCQKKVSAGYYVKNANDASQTECDKGYWKGEHWIKYGQTSTCTQCPAGYRDGTAVANKVSESKCLMIVPDGKYVKKATDSAGTNCDAGYYKASHNVTYGGTSTCTQCSAGTYNTTEGNKTCSNCGQGYFCAGGTDRHGCPAGYVGKSGVTTGSTRDNACNKCTAGHYCTGVNADTACAVGSYSGEGASACTACTGKTTSSTGQTSCNADCSNKNKVTEWNTASWTANSVTNLCSAKACSTGYTLSSNKCNANQYTVTYKANCGTSADQSQTVTYDSAWTTKGAVFTCTAYTQTGWSTSASGSITHNLNTNQGAWASTSNLTLYGTWRPNCRSDYTYQSDGTCKKTYTATTNYKCDSGWTLSGTTCSKTSTANATPNYSCSTGYTLSGSNCSKTDTANATAVYTCPSGWSLSGTTCTHSYQSGTCCDGEVIGDYCVESFVRTGNGATCTTTGWTCTRGTGSHCYGSNIAGISQTGCRPNSSPSHCDCRKQLSFYTCTVSESRAATFSNYTCSSGWTLSGTTCSKTTTVAATVSSYSCSSGWTLSGSTCSKTDTANATVYYTCATGDTLSGTTCTSIYTP